MQTPAIITNVTIDPPGEQWGALLAKRRVDDRSKRFREQIGLPTDRPIVMSGHQAAFWHAGILAKYFAVQAACEEFGAAGAWVVVDQDGKVGMDVAYCVVEKNGRLRHAVDSINAKELDIRGTVALPSIEAGLKEIRRAMQAHAGETSYDRQISFAARDLIRQVTPAPTPELFFATRLWKTDLFAWFLERMVEDPAACVQAYNRAVDDHPESGMARLRVPGSGEHDYELPLWFLEPEVGKATEPPRAAKSFSSRRRVTRTELPGMARYQLAPRALLMTALLRLAGCDLFVHGTGGAAYDRVTDQWIRDWLGESLAPTAMVTATMLLPLVPDVGATVAATRAVWLAHRALHDPAVVGDEATLQEKRRLLHEIAAAKARGERPHAPYRELHAHLESMRSRFADTLNGLTRAAAEAKVSASMTGLATDRTWAFPLFPHDDLKRLAAEIRGRFHDNR